MRKTTFLASVLLLLAFVLNACGAKVDKSLYDKVIQEKAAKEQALLLSNEGLTETQADLERCKIQNAEMIGQLQEKGEDVSLLKRELSEKEVLVTLAKRLEMRENERLSLYSSLQEKFVDLLAEKAVKLEVRDGLLTIVVPHDQAFKFKKNKASLNGKKLKELVPKIVNVLKTIEGRHFLITSHVQKAMETAKKKKGKKAPKDKTQAQSARNARSFEKHLVKAGFPGAAYLLAPAGSAYPLAVENAPEADNRFEITILPNGKDLFFATKADFDRKLSEQEAAAAEAAEKQAAEAPESKEAPVNPAAAPVEAQPENPPADSPKTPKAEEAAVPTPALQPVAPPADPEKPEEKAADAK